MDGARPRRLMALPGMRRGICSQAIEMLAEPEILPTRRRVRDCFARA